MKTISCILFVSLMFSFSHIHAQAINTEKTVTHFYLVNMDNNLLDITTPAKANVDIFESEALKNEMLSHVMDSIYTISSQMFKSELGLEFLPLDELKSKIKYNSEFPNCPDVVNIKKVLKKASGYKYYADYYVNIFSGYSGEHLAKPRLSQIKPLYTISFTLYDNSGKIVKKIYFSYKSKNALSDDKKGSAKSNNNVKSDLCHLYRDAFKEFSQEYKRVLIAKL